MTALDLPRWPCGEPVCPTASLPCFESESAAKASLALTMGSYAEIWVCSACGFIHFWPTPRGSSAARVGYEIPERIKKLIEETKL